jgi:hypothetical protein
LPDIITRLQQAGMDFAKTLSYLNRGINISVVNGVVLWHVIYSALHGWAKSNQKIRFVNLDDVVRDPLKTYEKLYHLFGLIWNEPVTKKIARYYNNNSERATPKAGKAHDRGRNVSAVNKYWRDYLTAQEKDFVNEVTEAQWSEFQKICVS